MVLGAFAKSTVPPPLSPVLPGTIPRSISQRFTELRDVQFRLDAISDSQRQQQLVLQQIKIMQRQILQFQHVQSEQLRLTQQMIFPMIFQNNRMMLQMMWPFLGP